MLAELPDSAGPPPTIHMPRPSRAQIPIGVIDAPVLVADHACPSKRATKVVTAVSPPQRFALSPTATCARASLSGPAIQVAATGVVAASKFVEARGSTSMA
jgi:hypothetical protein